jgi:hypothetical protein
MPIHTPCPLSQWQEERLRRFKSGKDGVGGITHRAATKQLWKQMQDEKLSKHVPRRFPITWFREFVHRYRDSVHAKTLQTLVEGAAETRAREKVRWYCPSLSMFVHVCPCLSMFVHVCPSLSIFVHLCPSLSILSHLVPSFAIL